jgi:hypothetical protein
VLGWLLITLPAKLQMHHVNRFNAKTQHYSGQGRTGHGFLPEASQ